MKRKKVLRILISILGILVMDFGVGVLIKANIGVDALNVFLTGAASKLQVSVGTTTLLFNIVILVAVLFIDRKQIGAASLLETLLCKFPLDFACQIIKTPKSVAGCVLLCLLAICTISLGVAMMMVSKEGLCVYDALSSSISNRYNLNYIVIRYICDGVYFLFGYLLKGQIGIGTIMCLIMFGTVINSFKTFLINTAQVDQYYDS